MPSPSRSSRGRSRRGGGEATASRRQPPLGGELRRLARAVRHLEIAALGESSVTRAQGHALLAIREMGRPSMAMLAATLGLAPSTVTRLVNPLVRQGLVERLPDPEDRRVIGLVLTAAGKRLLKRFEQQMIDAYSRVADGIPRGEQGAMRDALSTLITAVEHASLELG